MQYLTLITCWRILEFYLQKQYPSVQRLQYHLPGEQFVVFKDTDDVESVINQDGIHGTMFTKWFGANINHPDANEFTYVEFPTKWGVWNARQKQWIRRKQRISIGRLAYAHPNSGERHYLGILLNKVQGAKCYEDIRRVGGVVHPTYKSACFALGLLEHDEWHEALCEASTWVTGSQLRNMFCSMLIFSEITNPTELWEKHWVDFTDDLQNRTRRQFGDRDICLDESELRNLGLLNIERILNRNGRSFTEFPPMPLLSSRLGQFIKNRLIMEELDYDSTAESHLFVSLHAGLNDDQRRVFNTIMDAYTRQTGGLFFVYGSGGIEKMYLWRTLIAKVRSQKKFVLSVASSGIAALLLPNGKTAHSLFKIPLNLHKTSCCYINHRTDLAMLIYKAELIIWDEAPMLSRYAFDTIDRTFRDIMQNTSNCSSEKVFGGKLFVPGGDFRQILPIITKGGCKQIVGASLPKSSIWKYYHVLHLKINMCVMANNVSETLRSRLHDFTEWIKMVGEGKVSGTSFGNDYDTNRIKIPDEFFIRNDERGVQWLIKSTYSEVINRYNDLSYLNERGILVLKNNNVDQLNSMMLSMIPGERRVFRVQTSYVLYQENLMIMFCTIQSF